MNYFAGPFFQSIRHPLMTLGRLGSLFTTIITLSLAAIWIIFGSILYESYRTEWASASLFVTNVDSLLEADITRSIEMYDLSLKSAAAGFSDLETMLLQPKLRQRVLFDYSTNASGLGSTLVFDATGNLLADSHTESPQSLNVADQDYFQIHHNGKYERELFISHPFKARSPQETWSIGLSRRLERPDGSFAGIVLGSLKLSFFSRLFGAVELPPGSTITIVHDDGTILMRSPFMGIGRDLNGTNVFAQISQMQAGQLRDVSPIDHVDRLFAFRRIGRLPITLSVGIPIDHFLLRWQWRVSFMAIGFFVLSGLIVVLAITLSNELHRRTLAEKSLSALATTDGLTTLANRRHFDETLEHEWRRAIRDGASIALLMVDGDFFKAYNDTYGHVQGDQALRAIAGALRDSVQRPSDLVARFGGEEFAILLPATDLDGAIQVGEIVRWAVARLEWAHTGSPLHRLTVSIGVAACLPSDPDSALSLVQAADFALYEAKENGRDRIATGERLDLARFGWRAAAQVPPAA